MKAQDPDQMERNAAELARLVRKAQDEMKTPAHFDYQRMLATGKFHRFQALLNAGFNDTQALYLVKD